MTQIFSADAFEHLFFPLNRKIYSGLERAFQRLEADQPGFLTALERLYRKANAKPPGQGISLADLGGLAPPAADLRLEIAAPDLKSIRKSTEAKIHPVPHRVYSAAEYPGCHLIVNIDGGVHAQTFIVPLAYLLRKFKPIVCKPGRCQVYQHRLFPMAALDVSGRPGPTGIQLSDIAARGLIYTGITRRDWRTRLKEHLAASRRQSPLLFHQALRGELIKTRRTEHEILRVGLSVDEALGIEEAEVERVSLYPLCPNGLNMVPGGRAGMAFIANLRGDPKLKLRPGETEEAYSDLVAEVFLRDMGKAAGSRISALWQSDLDYRVRALTGSKKRLSELQIASARIWHASGWPIDKIVQNLAGIDGRHASFDQVKRLLKGQTYHSIPARYFGKPAFSPKDAPGPSGV